MSRVQLGLNVTDIDEAVDFYTKLFDTKPLKTRPGYANFLIEDPPLKLVLFESDTDHRLNHLGVETDTGAEVVSAEARLRDAGLTTTGIDDTECCYAEKTETWVHDPDGAKWEYYVKHADSEQMANVIVDHTDTATGACNTDTGCCA